MFVCDTRRLRSGREVDIFKEFTDVRVGIVKLRMVAIVLYCNVNFARTGCCWCGVVCIMRAYVYLLLKMYF